MYKNNSEGAESRYDLSDKGGFLLLQHLDREDLYIHLKASIGEPRSPSGHESTMAKGAPLVMPQEDKDTISERLDQYIGKLAQNFEESQPSHILLVTIRQASQMAAKDQVRALLNPVYSGKLNASYGCCDGEQSANECQ